MKSLRFLQLDTHLETTDEFRRLRRFVAKALGYNRRVAEALTKDYLTKMWSVYVNASNRTGVIEADAEDIAHHCQYEGDPEDFLEALTADFLVPVADGYLMAGYAERYASMFARLEKKASDARDARARARELAEQAAEQRRKRTEARRRQRAGQEAPKSRRGFASRPQAEATRPHPTRGVSFAEAAEAADFLEACDWQPDTTAQIANVMQGNASDGVAGGWKNRGQTVEEAQEEPFSWGAGAPAGGDGDRAGAAGGDSRTPRMQRTADLMQQNASEGVGAYVPQGEVEGSTRPTEDERKNPTTTDSGPAAAGRCGGAGKVIDLYPIGWFEQLVAQAGLAVSLSSEDARKYQQVRPTQEEATEALQATLAAVRQQGPRSAPVRYLLGVVTKRREMKAAADHPRQADAPQPTGQTSAEVKAYVKRLYELAKDPGDGEWFEPTMALAGTLHAMAVPDGRLQKAIEAIGNVAGKHPQDPWKQLINSLRRPPQRVARTAAPPHAQASNE